jgi:hypothetical protein
MPRLILVSAQGSREESFLPAWARRLLRREARPASQRVEEDRAAEVVEQGVEAEAAVGAAEVDFVAQAAGKEVQAEDGSSGIEGHRARYTGCFLSRSRIRRSMRSHSLSPVRM